MKYSGDERKPIIRGHLKPAKSELLNPDVDSISRATLYNSVQKPVKRAGYCLAKQQPARGTLAFRRQVHRCRRNGGTSDLMLEKLVE